MRKAYLLLISLLLFCVFPTLSFGVLTEPIIVEFRTTGSNNNSGATRWLNIVTSTYRWTQSPANSNEYYCELASGGSPGFTSPGTVQLDGHFNIATKGTVGSLNVSEWDFGDNDSLGFNTVYVRLADSGDPDDKGYFHVARMFGTNTIDYSQQNASQLSVTDGTTSGAGSTTLTSSTGGFTAAMVSNTIYIRSGTNFTVGLYQINTFTNTNNIILDRSPTAAGAGSGGTGEIGGARAVPTDAYLEATVIEKGRHYFKSGTYTLTESLDIIADGNIATTSTFNGYATSRGDNPTTTDRPLWVGGAYNINFDNYIAFYGIRGTTTVVNGLRADTAFYIENSKFQNTSATANRKAFAQGGSGFRFINSEAISDNGYGVSTGTNFTSLGGVFRDSVYGIYNTGGGANIQYCIFYSNTTGLGGSTSTSNVKVVSSTFYNNTDAIKATTNPGGWSIFNNNFNLNTTAINFPRKDSNTFDYNNYFNNTTDLANFIVRGSNSTSLDPEFTDAPNGDFSVGENMKGIGFPGTFSDGLSTGYLDIGAIQREEPAAGGGGTGFFMVD